MTTLRRRNSGFTLLELTVVLSIFALMSVMALQALRGTIRGQTRIEAHAATNADLARLLIRLRRDLEAGIPLAFTDAQGNGRGALVLAPGGAGFDLSLGGQPGLRTDGADGGLHRVEWRFDPAAGTLTRRIWLSLTPAQSGAPGPDVVQMEEVAGLQVAAFGPGGQWQTDWIPDPEAGFDTLPRALRVRIDSRTLGTFELIERF